MTIPMPIGIYQPIKLRYFITSH